MLPPKSPKSALKLPNPSAAGAEDGGGGEIVAGAGASAGAGGGKLSRYQIGQLFALTHVFNCINWSFFILQNWLPTYMVTLGLDLKKSAGLSALPFLMMAICSKVGGAVSQNLIKAKGWETIKVRRLMILISSLIPAAALMVLCGVTNPMVAVVILMIALGSHRCRSFPFLLRARHAHSRSSRSSLVDD